MRLFTLFLTVPLMLSLVGCCCPSEPAAGLAILAEATLEPERQFLVVRCTVLEEEDAEAKQILVESSVVSVRGTAPIEALERARRLDDVQAPAWLAGDQLPEATFDERSEVISKPSIVTRSGDEATIVLSEGGEGVRTRTDLSVTPTLREGGVELRLTYAHHDHGTLVRTIPPVTLRAPDRRVFIVEALPAR